MQPLTALAVLLFSTLGASGPSVPAREVTCAGSVQQPAPRTRGVPEPDVGVESAPAQARPRGFREQRTVGERIVTPAEVEAAARPGVARPFLVIAWPYRQVLSGIHAGLLAIEKHKLHLRALDLMRRLEDRGIRPVFGGLGEGAGFGAGIVYDAPPRSEQGLQLMARLSVTGYQELAARLETAPVPRSSLVLQTDYQWRPAEPFYGLGQDSRQRDTSSFALRQWSAGVLWETRPADFLRVGAQYKLGLLKALDSTGGGRPAVSAVFGDDLPGLGERVDLHTVGAYFDLDFMSGDHMPDDDGLGGRVHGGASWQAGLGDSGLRYGRYELRLEGRLPVVQGRSFLVGQAGTELTREAAGSPPLPFYLFPRIGGSATLRGFDLDRFYGRNMIFLSLEYRYDIHPNFQVSLFHDAGQIFRHGRDLQFFDWHRNYGIGFRYRTLTGTKFLVELGPGDEGFAFHISFGERAPRPLGGPIRYPLYRQ